MTLRGEWNGHIYAKKGNEEEFLFSDVREKPDVPKVTMFNFRITITIIILSLR